MERIRLALSTLVFLHLVLATLEQCPPLNLGYGVIIGLNGTDANSVNDFKEGDSLRFQCANGYTLVGSSGLDQINSTTTCLGSSGWSLDEVNCTEILCRNPPSIANGAIVHVNNVSSIGSVVIYSCNAGYEFQWPDDGNGRLSTFCNTSAQWHSVPICVASRRVSAYNVLVIVLAVVSSLFGATLCLALICSLWACMLRRQLTRGDLAEDEVAYARSQGAFTLNNPMVSTKDDESAGNPLYLTPDEMNEFESKKRQLGGTG